MNQDIQINYCNTPIKIPVLNHINWSSNLWYWIHTWVSMWHLKTCTLQDYKTWYIYNHKYVKKIPKRANTSENHKMHNKVFASLSHFFLFLCLVLSFLKYSNGVRYNNLSGLLTKPQVLSTKSFKYSTCILILTHILGKETREHMSYSFS